MSSRKCIQACICAVLSPAFAPSYDNHIGLYYKAFSPSCDIQQILYYKAFSPCYDIHKKDEVKQRQVQQDQKA